jgi:hypothetical protein
VPEPPAIPDGDGEDDEEAADPASVLE